jgi:pyridoxamine 5'-phosphate oxidase
MNQPMDRPIDQPMNQPMDQPIDQPMTDLAQRREEYETTGIDAGDLDPDPIVQWQRWYDQAATAGCVEPNAMVLGTIADDGFPQSRYVLVRGVGADGFAFYTNLESDKSRQLAASDKASGLFTWLQLHRQVRVVGTVERLDDAASDAYFAARPRDSQLGAWASPQSQVLPDRQALDERVARFTETFAGVDEVPRPVYWGGYRLRPLVIEFWQGRRSRLHDRLRYRRERDGRLDSWVIERLAP